MAFHLTQSRADELIAMEKHRADESIRNYPTLGSSVSVPLVSADGKEHFSLDISRCRINFSRGTLLIRGNKMIVLARVDFGGPPHCNPDGSEIPCPHLHVYREGWADRWAICLPPDIFSDPADRWQISEDFAKYCNITRAPKFQKGLWS